LHEHVLKIPVGSRATRPWGCNREWSRHEPFPIELSCIIELTNDFFLYYLDRMNSSKHTCSKTLKYPRDPNPCMTSHICILVTRARYPREQVLQDQPPGF